MRLEGNKMITDWFWERKTCTSCENVENCIEITINNKPGEVWDGSYKSENICINCLRFEVIERNKYDY